MRNQRDIAIEHAVKGKIIYLLALIVLVQFGYPVSTYGTPALILYELLYVSMISVGVILGRDSLRHMLFLGFTGFIFLVASMLYAFNPAVIWTVLITYLSLIPYLGMLIWVLGRFLLIAKTITLDVIYSAVAIYLLLGALFVPLYGMLNMFIPDSFRDSSFPGITIQWQQIIYFSYTTLTSTGYGDFLPVSTWARSLANFEMITGIMFITIIMARLVSLYSTEKETK